MNTETNKFSKDVSVYFSDIYKAVIDQMLEEELEEQLGYPLLTGR